MGEEFNPNWAIHPGPSIRDGMIEKDISWIDLMSKLNINEQEFDMLMDGRRAITPDLAEGLEASIGGSKIFWLRREAQHRAHVARLTEEKMCKGDARSKQSMLKVNGSTFRCECGCNVFTEYSELKYSCNGCGELYKGERDDA